MNWLSSRFPQFLPSWRSRLATLETSAKFYPTPLCVARQMLELANVTAEDIVYDVGSGDGRIPILAAQEFDCRAVGIERNRGLCRRSADRTQELRLHDRVCFERGNFFHSDFQAATVVTLYLLSAVNEQLQARLASHLRPGARVVALDYPVPGWKPETVQGVHSVNGIEYTLYLYRRRGKVMPKSESSRSRCAPCRLGN
jgi:SAM-dependent methyltransferase